MSLDNPTSVSDKNLLTVMNCLMHTEDCEILECPCRTLKERYEHLFKASGDPLNQEIAGSPSAHSDVHDQAVSSTSVDGVLINDASVPIAENETG